MKTSNKFIQIKYIASIIGLTSIFTAQGYNPFAGTEITQGVHTGVTTGGWIKNTADNITKIGIISNTLTTVNHTLDLARTNQALMGAVNDLQSAYGMYQTVNSLRSGGLDGLLGQVTDAVIPNYDKGSDIVGNVYRQEGQLGMNGMTKPSNATDLADNSTSLVGSVIGNLFKSETNRATAFKSATNELSKGNKATDEIFNAKAPKNQAELSQASLATQKAALKQQHVNGTISALGLKTANDHLKLANSKEAADIAAKAKEEQDQEIINASREGRDNFILSVQQDDGTK